MNLTLAGTMQPLVGPTRTLARLRARWLGNALLPAGCVTRLVS